jgi:trk system potassium uptake protein TrkH
VLGFAGLILMGTLLLMLPWSTADGSPPPLSVALFTATSAVCVTGLVVVDTGTYWSTFGQTVILLLIQIGGIGFGAAASFLFWLAGRNISLTDRLHLTALLPGTTVNKVARVALYIVGVSLLIQTMGALLLFIGWIERYPAGTAAFMAVFHSISAFCNAGFDIFGSVGAPNTSLAPVRHQPLVALVITLLVLIGGLGFPVLLDLLSRWRYRRRPLTKAAAYSGEGIRPPLSLHARLVLVAHLGLFAASVALFWLLELDNPATLGSQTPGNQFIDAVYTAAQPRTAGYSTIPLVNYVPTSLLLIILLMFVGAGSAGTGGGVKVNTVATLFASVLATVAGKPAPQLFKRSLTSESINKALAVIMIGLAVIAAATFILSLTEPNISIEHLLFEVVSAFSTVGLSVDVTPRLSEAGRVIIELLMFTGRLGPLTLVILLTAREHPPRIRYAEEPVLIG